MKCALTYLSVALFALASCKNQNTEGKKLYNQHCIHCHQEGGKGVGKLIPPISGNFLKDHEEDLACLIQHGMKGEIVVDGVVYNHEMPPNDKLTKFDMVNMLNYLEEKYGTGKTDKYDVEQVEKTLNRCP